MPMRPVWFWQRTLSPLMFALAREVARRGVDVTFVVEEELSSERRDLGWQVPDAGAVTVRIAATAAEMVRVAEGAPGEAFHVMQGIVRNGSISDAQRVLADRGVRQWVVLETLDDRGAAGRARRLEYRVRFARRQRHLAGVLAIGRRTPAWLRARGVDPDLISPFAYFIDAPSPVAPAAVESTAGRAGAFQFAFFGQLIARKAVALLIDALSECVDVDFELVVAGTGELEADLRSQAERQLPGRVKWLGAVPSSQVREHLAQADCLVLPSVHDGWGAVVSEALVVGTRAIASDRCGSSGVVEASHAGSVFRTGDRDDLVAALRSTLSVGPVTAHERQERMAWASCLGAEAGADYLLSVLTAADSGHARPSPPWEVGP